MFFTFLFRIFSKIFAKLFTKKNFINTSFEQNFENVLKKQLINWLNQNSTISKKKTLKLNLFFDCDLLFLLQTYLSINKITKKQNIYINII